MRTCDRRKRARIGKGSENMINAGRFGRLTCGNRLSYLTTTCGFDEATSKTLIKEKSSRRDNRSPHRN